MKDWLKKYWWAILIILILPVAINFALLVPAFSPIVGEDTDWLAFWGGYLGAIISAAVAFIILYIQRKDNEQQVKDTQAENETQNKANRKLQLNILRYQQEQIRLNNFIAVSSKLITSINPLSLKALCKQIQENNVPQIEKAILDSIDYICRVQREFCLHLSDKDERQKQLGKKANNIIDRFTDVQCDIQNLLLIISVSDVPMTNQLLKEYATDNDEMSKRLKKAILDYTPSKYDGVKLEWEWESIAIALVDLVQNESDKLYDLIDDFVDEERKRIQDILTEGI